MKRPEDQPPFHCIASHTVQTDATKRPEDQPFHSIALHAVQPDATKWPDKKDMVDKLQPPGKIIFSRHFDPPRRDDVDDYLAVSLN